MVAFATQITNTTHFEPCVCITNDLKHEKQVIAALQRSLTVLRSVKSAFLRFDIETFSIMYTTYKNIRHFNNS